MIAVGAQAVHGCNPMIVLSPLGPGLPGRRSCGTALFFEGVVEEHLNVGLIRKPLPMREILSRLDIEHRESHGNGFQWHRPASVAGLQRAFHDLRGRLRMAVPPFGLGGFGLELWNCDLLCRHGHFVRRDYPDLAAPFGIKDCKQAPRFGAPKTEYPLLAGV